MGKSRATSRWLGRASRKRVASWTRIWLVVAALPFVTRKWRLACGGGFCREQNRRNGRDDQPGLSACPRSQPITIKHWAA